MSLAATAVTSLAPLLVGLSADLGVSLAQAGQLAVITAIPWAIGAPFTGLISDRYGRRPVLLVAIAGMGAATLAGAFAPVFWLLVVSRLLTGAFGSGGPSAIIAGLADIYPPDRRGFAFGWVNSAYSWAALIGVPVVGAIGGLWGWRVAFAVTGLALIAAAVYLLLAFPSRRRREVGAGNPIRTYGHLFTSPPFTLFLLANLCQQIIFMAATLYLAAFLMQSQALTAIAVAPALAVMAVGTLIGAVTGGSLADRFSRPFLAAGEMALAGVCGLAAFAFPDRLEVAVAAGFGFSLLISASRPPLTALLMGVSNRYQGAVSGLFATSNQVGIAVGAGLGGLAFEVGGYPTLGAIVLVFGLVSAGLVLAGRPLVRPLVAPATWKGD